MSEGDRNQNQGEEKQNPKSSRLWTPYGDPREDGYRQPEAQAGPEAGGEVSGPEEEISEEELRRRIDEAMERITVADVIVDMMVSLSSLAYQRMGLPHEVNEKYRDLEQARLAIDCLDTLLQAISGRAPDEMVNSLTGTMDNLKLNFAKES